ncbi:MAG TPA: hypothetical protein VF795_05850 [Desulfuromonadaceae bacterium]
MNSRRFIAIVAMLIILPLCGRNRAEAFLGFGEGHGGDQSGLDLNRGYDVNTVTTVAGKVLATLRAGERRHVIIAVRAPAETINICVGPSSYWDKNGIQLHPGDEISAKGSRAQGKDGKIYLLAQRLADRTTGAQVILRNEAGQPRWLSTGTAPGGR